MEAPLNDELNNDQTMTDDLVEDTSVKTENKKYSHTPAGKATIIATAVLLAGTVAIAGEAYYSTSQSDSVYPDEEFDEEEYLLDEECFSEEDDLWNASDNEYFSDDEDVIYDASDDSYYSEDEGVSCNTVNDDFYFEDDEEADYSENSKEQAENPDSSDISYSWYENDGPADMNDEYILPESDSRYYTTEELQDYDKDLLRIARNEIYARHGRLFDSEDLQEYFNSQSWYHGTVKAADFNENVFNKYEKANISTIQFLENGQSTSGLAESDESVADTSNAAASESDNEPDADVPDSDYADFADSWDLIKSFELSSDVYDSRDLNNSKYFCQSLSFTVYGSTLVDMGGYYEVRAAFNKPVMVPQDMKIGDQYTVLTDELEGTATTFTGANDVDGGFCLFEEDSEIARVYGWYGDFNGQDGMTELIGDDGARLETPFYKGTLRIRKDAVTGDLLNLDVPYETVTVSELEGHYEFQDSLWSNYTAFDEEGYVTELIYNGC